MGLDSGLTWSVVSDFCFRYCLEGSGGHHEFSDAFTKAADLNLDVLDESIAGPSPNDHGFLWVYYC